MRGEWDRASLRQGVDSVLVSRRQKLLKHYVQSCELIVRMHTVPHPDHRSLSPPRSPSRYRWIPHSSWYPHRHSIVQDSRNTSSVRQSLDPPATHCSPIVFSVRGKPHSWDPLACLASARSLLTFLHSQITSHSSNLSAQSQFDASILDSASEISPRWPVFRIVFVPSGERGAEVSLRALSEEEIATEVKGGKRPAARVGMLLERWIVGVRSRRR